LLFLDSNVLVAEADTAAEDVSVPVAEWMSQIITPSETSKSTRSCLLYDLYLHKNLFHRVSFEMIYRLVDDADTVKTVNRKKRLFSISNDGVTDRVKDVFEFSLKDGTSQFQVGLQLSVLIPRDAICITRTMLSAICLSMTIRYCVKTARQGSDCLQPRRLISGIGLLC